MRQPALFDTWPDDELDFDAVEISELTDRELDELLTAGLGRWDDALVTLLELAAPERVDTIAITTGVL